jgi:metal-responsive CopG/Arc/MetJ family transcriptional regulator
MKKETQDRSVTIRIKKDLYQSLTNIAINKSVNEGNIIKISEIIRIALENYIKDENINN